MLLRVAIDGVEPCQLEGTDRDLARRLFGDVDEIPPAARRALVWRLGRGSGKTTLSAALSLWAMWTADLSRVGVGMLAAAVCVSPTRATSTILVKVARELARQSALARHVIKKSDSAEGFELKRPDGRTVALKSVAASRGGQTLRGFDILCLVLDESEFFSSNDDAAADVGYAINDRDIYAAARPRCLGFVLFVSTPWPTPNLTSDLFDRNFGHPVDALATLGPSTFMRPDDTALAEAVEHELVVDEDNARRERFCEPGTRGGSRLLDASVIDAAIVDGRPLVISATPGGGVGVGGDLGLEHESSAVAAVSRSAVEAYELLEFDEIRPGRGVPLEPGYVIRERFAPLMHRHGARAICMDAHYRQSAIEHLSALSLGFVDAPAGNEGKYTSFMYLRACFRAGCMRIPNSARLLTQLRAVTMVPMPGGKVRIVSPRRAGQGHGDVVSALVLAVWQARGSVGAATWSSFARLNDAASGAFPSRDLMTIGRRGSPQVPIGGGMTGQNFSSGGMTHRSTYGGVTVTPRARRGGW